MTITDIFKRALQLFVLAVLVYFAWVIYRDSRETPPIESSDPLLILNDYRILRYNPVGTLEYILVGDVLIQYDNDEGGYLTTPFLTHYNPESIQIHGLTEKSIDWTAKSRYASYTQDKTLLTLIEDVVLHKPDLMAPENNLTVETELLYVHDQGERVTTDLFVEIRTPSRKINGLGLEGFPPIEQFTILRDVKSTFITKQGSADE